MADLLSGLIAKAREVQAQDAKLDNTSRILGLPVEHYTDEEKLALVDKWWHALRIHPDARKPRPIQAEILEVAYRQSRKSWPAGLLGLVGVGAGKTLSFFLIPQVYEARRPLLLLPADMISGGNLEAAWHEWTQEYDLLPMHIVKGGLVPNLSKRTMFVMSYAQLSQPTGTDVLRRMAPDLILADEAHKLGAATSARTKRFMRYMKAVPGTRFVPMSGTMTGKSLKDYWHLAYLALRDESFLPEDTSDLDRWCGVLDADTTANTLDRFLLDPLVTWARKQAGAAALDVLAGEDEVRQAYNYRMVTCPGVVATTSPSCDSRLVLTGWSNIAFADESETEMTVPDAMRHLSNNDELPNGLIMEDALSKARAMQQLSMGFYYYWDWPLDKDGQPIVDVDYVEAKRGYDGAIRQYLKSYSREGCDSPMLVDQYVRQRVAAGKPVSPDLVYWQEQWDEQKKKPEPPTKARWLDFSVIIEAVAWSRKHEGFVWFDSRAVGEALQAFGLPTFWEGMPDPKHHRRAALSLNVFNKGKNLQPWDNQLFMQVPSDAKLWEQALGRTHRAGQTSPVVRATIMQHTWVLRKSWRKSLERATYIQATTGQLQRLCFAEKHGLTEAQAFDPKPY
jgi:hypothetical protein